MKPKIYFSLHNCPRCDVPWFFDTHSETEIGHYYYECRNYPSTCTFTHRRTPSMILIKMELNCATIFWDVEKGCRIVPREEDRAFRMSNLKNYIAAEWLDYKNAEEQVKFYLTFS